MSKNWGSKEIKKALNEFSSDETNKYEQTIPQ